MDALTNTLPKTTRLRFVKAKDPSALVDFFDRLGVRVSLQGPPQWGGKYWVAWFIPSDKGQDIKSIDLDNI